MILVNLCRGRVREADPDSLEERASPQAWTSFQDPAEGQAGHGISPHGWVVLGWVLRLTGAIR